MRNLLTRSLFALAILSAGAGCSGAVAGVEDETDEAAAKARIDEVKVQASGDVFVKKGNKFVQVFPLQTFHPDLPGQPGAPKIARDGNYEFVVFAGTPIGRLKDLKTGAVAGFKIDREVSEKTDNNATSLFTHYKVDRSLDLRVFAPVDTGALTRPVSGASLMGTLPSTPEGKRAGVMATLKSRLKDGRYKGVNESGESACEVVMTPEDDEPGIEVEIFTLANGRRRLSDALIPTRFIDGSLELPHKVALQNLGTTILVDETKGLRVEVAEILGNRRVCRDLVPIR